ncbi:MAG: DNA-protecting protein DprA [Spirochaetes bacterium]|nr:DNA-protecting protein DprA [Spirochaetota bacterium]
MDDDKRFNSVMLSVLASPASSGIVYSMGIEQGQIMENIRHRRLKVQEHLVKRYGDDPFAAAEKIIRSCEASGIGIVTVWDDEYPPLLREIYMPPLVIYCRGKPQGGRHVSIVGTRGSNAMSEEITRRIASTIAMRGITVTSGLALGIDRNAHVGALSVEGSTLAVLPQGVDVITPASNRDIYEKIISSPGSAVISELPPGIRSGDTWVFAKRNRIISGISWATVIVQAPLKSGAMITARYALEQNRDLYVCPGNIYDSGYSGCNNLIKQGAQVISDIEEFICEIDPLYCAREKEPVSNGEDIQLSFDAEKISMYNGAEKLIMQAASGAWADIDEIARSNSVPVDEIARAVTLLEISGNLIRRGNKVRTV